MHRVLCKHSRSIMDEMDGWITSVLQSREARQPRRPKRIFFSVIRNAGTGRLLPGSMKFRIRREEWILNAFVDQSGQLAIRYGRKLQKRVIGRRERLRVLLPRVQIGRVIFLTFPSPKVPISLATINCFSINEEEKFDGPSSCNIFFKRCPSNVFLSNEGKISMENRFVIDRNEIV